MSDTLTNVRYAVKHWYLPLFAGTLLIFLGLWVFTFPLEALVISSIFFALALLVSGVLETLFSIFNHRQSSYWAWSLFIGLVTTFIGWSLITHPALSLATLITYIGLIVFFRSIALTVLAIDVKEHVKTGWESLMFFGIAGILIAIAMLIKPGFGGLSLVVWMGVSYIVMGIGAVMYSLTLRDIKKSTN